MEKAEELAKLLKGKTMNIYTFIHSSPEKCGGCNYRYSKTFWMGEDEESVTKKRIEEHIEEGGEEPIGLCARCLVEAMKKSIEKGDLALISTQ